MRTLLAMLAAALLSVAFAHSGLEKPPRRGRQKVSAPKQVVLTFSELMELRCSTFKVYAVNAGGNTLKVNAADRALRRRC